MQLMNCSLLWSKFCQKKRLIAPIRSLFSQEQNVQQINLFNRPYHLTNKLFDVFNDAVYRWIWCDGDIMISVKRHSVCQSYYRDLKFCVIIWVSCCQQACFNKYINYVRINKAMRVLLMTALCFSCANFGQYSIALIHKRLICEVNTDSDLNCVWINQKATTKWKIY